MSTNGLPRGWVDTCLADTCLITLGQSPPSSSYNIAGNGLPFFQGKAEFGPRHPCAVKWCTKPKKIAEENDVLISVRAPVGPTNICPEKACIGRGLASLRPLGGISALFLFYALRAMESDIAAEGTGTTFKAITGNQLRAVRFALCPLAEQKRIVAKMEELFSDLDAGVETLKKLRVLIKRYRQSVLKAAFEGKLTEEWREQHKHELEPASVLLERIREERKKKAKEQGKKYKEPPPVDTSDLPGLPEGWEWASLGQLASPEPNAVTDGPFGSNLKTSHYRPSGPRVIRLQNIGDGTFVGAEAHISEDHFQKLARHRIEAGDLVIASLGDPLPRCCVVPSFVGPAIVKADCIKFRPVRRKVLALYLNYVLNAKPTRTRAAAVVHGVSRPRLGLKSISRIPVPVASFGEQGRIVGEVERRLSVAEEAATTVEDVLRQANSLRQAILSRAFEGKLVPQDPNDEPAEKLLERIKAEKAKMQAAKPNKAQSARKKRSKEVEETF